MLVYITPDQKGQNVKLIVIKKLPLLPLAFGPLELSMKPPHAGYSGTSGLGVEGCCNDFVTQQHDIGEHRQAICESCVWWCWWGTNATT